MIFGGLFDFDKKEEKIKKLEEITKESNFWDDVSLANKKITELNNLKKEINNICSLKEKINNNYIIELDRKKAINKGINMLTNNDILLILGKGHENYQIIGNNKTHFNDKETVLEITKEK